MNKIKENNYDIEEKDTSEFYEELEEDFDEDYEMIEEFDDDENFDYNDAALSDNVSLYFNSFKDIPVMTNKEEKEVSADLLLRDKITIFDNRYKTVNRVIDLEIVFASLYGCSNVNDVIDLLLLYYRAKTGAIDVKIRNYLF